MAAAPFLGWRGGCTSRIDDENFGWRDAGGQVADLVCQPVPKARIKWVPAGWKESSHLLKAPGKAAHVTETNRNQLGPLGT
jgi:hypothetical protein